MNKLKLAIALCLVLIIVFVVFCPSLKNGFVNWDDSRYVNENPFISSFSLRNIKSIFTSSYFGNYHPITMLTFVIEYQFFRNKPFGYHLMSLLMHLLNCILVFYLIFLLSKRSSVALITALFWGIHPLNVDSVVWVSETKGILCALFYIGALICYFKYLCNNYINKFYYLSLLLFVLSVLAKPIAISLPPMLFLIDYWFKRKPNKIIFIDKIPFFILSFIFGLIAIFAQYSFGAIRHESILNLLSRTAIILYNIVFYLYKISFPVNLSCLYPHPDTIGNYLPLQFFVSPFVIVILASIVFFSRNYTRILFLGLAFYLIAIFPALQFIPISESIVANRYAYLPSVAIFYIFAEGLVWLYTKCKI